MFVTRLDKLGVTGSSPVSPTDNLIPCFLGVNAMTDKSHDSETAGVLKHVVKQLEELNKLLRERLPKSNGTAKTTTK